MKRTLVSIQVAAAITLPTLVASADFRVAIQQSKISGELRTACPSNYYNCTCFDYGDRRRGVDYVKYNELGLLDYFRLDAGMCGVTKTMDFYWRPEGHYDFYITGDSALQGQCFGGDFTTMQCNQDQYAWLECISYICGR